MRSRFIPFIAILTLAASAAQAQTYRCTSGGATYFSDRPCGAAAPAQLRAIGPTRATTPYVAPLPGAPKAQDHVKYLSPDCASISEAIRTAPARGVRGDVVGSLHEEYRQKCALEDQDARRQANQEQVQAQQVKLAQRESAHSARVQAAQAQERCAGMRDVIALKRKRESALNDKEIEALRSLEATYNQGCVGR
jgi:hypothetical protein